jgi:hypothetical protein
LNDKGSIATWAFMEAALIVWIEIDTHENGRLDRWEYYTRERKLERVGWSRAGNYTA